jgi:hypothetical protein
MEERSVATMGKTIFGKVISLLWKRKNVEPCIIFQFQIYIIVTANDINAFKLKFLRKLRSFFITVYSTHINFFKFTSFA